MASDYTTCVFCRVPHGFKHEADCPALSEEPRAALSEEPRADVNDRQVGGAHYKSKYQHWDFVVDTHQNYHQGNATAYISRWRRKNGVEDLEKALHYIDKCESLKLQKISAPINKVFAFAFENDLTAIEVGAVWAVVTHEWEAAREWVRLLISSAGAAAQTRRQPM